MIKIPMKLIAAIFAVSILVFAAYIACKAWHAPQRVLLQIGNFVVLTLTFIVLVWYAVDTNAIAKVTHERWMRDGVLSTTYGIQLLGEKGDVGRTLFQLLNPSRLLVHAKSSCNFRIYGESVASDRLYDGKDNWLLFPQQQSQGWFDLESLLQKKGKTVAGMIAEFAPGNRETQLTMDLELEFWDELGGRRKLPARHHYFDFDRWNWIPALEERESNS
jgi:hypothetical protein